MTFSFDPFHIFKVEPQPCHLVFVTVLCGRNITKGRLKDALDTPDPYIQLNIDTSPSGLQQTKVCDNTKDPEWNQEFKFIIDPRQTNTLEIKLREANLISDDDLGTEEYDLEDLTIAESTKITLTFGTTCEVDIEILRVHCNRPDLRHALTLCDQEKAFRRRRKKKVFEVMKNVLGDEAPANLDEVPIIGVLGSGGGFRAMTGLAGSFSALRQTGILDMVMYTAGLSGSAWYLAQLYADSDWMNRDPADALSDLKHRIKHNWVSKAIDRHTMSRYMEERKAKRKRGQPTSFTDWFGHVLGEILLKDRITSCLSDQATMVETADSPLPLYSCVHVKPTVSAQTFSEWVDFSPFEISMPKYGTSLCPSHLNSVFYLGRIVRQCPEPPLHFLMGMWGSAFTILLNRLRKNNEENGQNGDEVDGIDIEDGLDEDDADTDEENELEETETEDLTDGALVMSAATSATSTVGGQLMQKLLKAKRLNTRRGRAAKVLNFLNGVNFSLTHPFSPFSYMHALPADLDERDPTVNISAARSLYMVDAGLHINLPFPLLLRQQRALDLIISYDFSNRETDNAFPFKELKECEGWARANGVPFPDIDITEEDVARDGIKECYVFSNPEDDTCPTILHLILVNDSFRRYKAPGVERTTDEEKQFADFSIYEDRENPYSTFNFTYSEKAFDRLSSLTAYNTLNNADVIRDVIKRSVDTRRRRARAAKTAWELALNIVMAKVDFSRLVRQQSINLDRMAQLREIMGVDDTEKTGSGEEVDDVDSAEEEKEACLADINLTEEDETNRLTEVETPTNTNGGYLCGGGSNKTCYII